MGKRKSVRKPLLEGEENEDENLLSLCKDEEDGDNIIEGYHRHRNGESSKSVKQEEKARLVSKSSLDLQPRYCCKVSGPGLDTATTNCPTCVLVELRDVVTGQPCTHSQALVAELQPQPGREDKQAHHHVPFWKRHKQAGVTVEQKTTATYCLHFTPITRGEHRLHISINGIEVRGSPCNIVAYPDPTLLKKAVGEISNCDSIWGVGMNSRGDIVASDFSGHKVLIISTTDDEEEVKFSFDCYSPTGIAVDSEDNIYVACVDQIKKFSAVGRLLTTVGKSGEGEGEFRSVEGLAHHKGLIYACDTLNNRIQVFDTDLNQVKTIGCEGCANIEFSHPWDIDFDSAGRAYIADKNNDRVQVIDVKRGGFLKQIGGGGKGKLSRPTGVHVAGEFVYISDDEHKRVAVFKTATGEFVTSFGAHTDPTGKKYRGPFRICSERGGDCRIFVFDLVSAHIY